MRELRRPLIWMMVAVLSAALVLGIGWAVARILDIAQTTQQTATQVSDCLSPRGACQKAARARQEETERTIVYAITCARHMPQASEEQVLACVERLLQRDAERGRPDRSEPSRGASER